MTDIYFFEIKENFNPLSLPFFEKTFSKERLKKPALLPEKKYVASLLGEAIVKNVTAKKFNTSAKNIIIEKTKTGKPYLKDFPDFYFNVSHSENAVAIAVSDKEIGIDIEFLRKPNLKVAERFFTKDEQEYIRTNPNQNTAFFEIWTKKESYYKYIGTGLNASIKKLSVFDSALNAHIETFIKNNVVFSVCTQAKENIDFKVINANDKKI